MRIFENCLEASKEIERDLWELGAVATTKSMQDQAGEFETRELVGYQFSVPTKDHTLWKELADHFQIPVEELKEYCMGETYDRITGVPNPGNSWKIRRSVWGQYLHDGKFSYTYPERIWQPTNQLGHVIQVLRFDQYSRQAIIQIYDKHTDFANTGGRARIPCSLSYQFICRSSDQRPTLHCIYTMRSCDYYKHFVYDMMITCEMVKWIASQLTWEYGNLIMQIGSLHAYREDLNKRKIF